MKTLPLTQKDFAWVKWTPKQMEKIAKSYLENKKKVYQEIKSILPEERTFLNTVYALERADDMFESALSKMGLLAETSTKKEVRDGATAVLSSVSEKAVDIEYDRDLYIAVLEYYEGNFRDEKKSLRKEDIKLIEETLREYKRIGFDLDTKKQKELKVLFKKSSKLSIAFRKNINDYQDYILCTKDELDGMSENYITALPRHTDGRYIVSLQYPHVLPFMSEAKNRKKREELALKNLKKGGKKNLTILNELVTIRHKIATILGYKHHADFKTENRMARSGEVASQFQEDLLKKIAPQAKAELQELGREAKQLGIKKLDYFDISFVGTSLKKKLYDIDPETVKAYFPTTHVQKEMFRIFGELFSISFHKTPLTLWHKDVESYEIRDESKDNKGALIGYFSLDLYPREGKYGHACMVDVVVSKEKTWKGEEYLPAYSVMLCNFPTPTKKVPSLLSISDVETLFHEFGHLLHMTLSRARLESQAGANVAWDFVETPSQIMENWVWDKKVMKQLSHNYKTQEKMDDAMIDRIVKGKVHMNAYFYTRQLIQGKLDMDLHLGKIKDVESVYSKMNKQFFNIDMPKVSPLFVAGFGHLVGYDAGYYSYLWALVYACDAFESFKTKGNKNVMTNAEVGMKWRREVLEKGSSEDEMKLLTNFLGRKPSNKAFLKELGIK
ncbi:MAG: hypothetical protein RI935_375 [Candidatus Parcubacteria bacterium]|jgi:thimet oligopeptidase